MCILHRHLTYALFSSKSKFFCLFVCLFSQGTSATAVAAAADSGKVSLLDPLSALNKAVTSSDIFQDETAGGDSLFSKPQKSLTSR